MFKLKLAILFIIAIVCSVLIVSPALAIPELQLNVPGGTYVSDFDGDGQLDGPLDEGMSTSSSNFTLQAFYKHNQDPNIGNPTFYLSCALLTLDGQTLSNDTTPLVNIVINGSPITTWSYGTPELMPPHGVFGTYYYQLAFNFAPGDYISGGIFNVADSTGSANGYVHDFNLDVSGLNNNYAMVFDLYTYGIKQDGDTKIFFAPFSHNASHNSTPEPASLTLLGLGLLGVLKFGKKRNKNF